MSGGGSFSSDQTTLQKDTGAISLLRAGRARITSIQGRGEAGSVILLHDAATTGAAAGSNLKATFKYDTEGLAEPASPLPGIDGSVTVTITGA